MSDIERIHELELKQAEQDIKVTDVVRRMESHFNDQRQQNQRIYDKLDKLPTEDRIIVLFRNEGEKLAAGLIKRDDEQETRLNKHSSRIINVEKDIREIQTTQKWHGLKLAGLGSVITGLIVKYWDRIIG